MKIVKPSISNETFMKPTQDDILTQLENIARTCYKSFDKRRPGSDYIIFKHLLTRKHMSILEHVTLTYRIVCDRGVSHELVRHRIASYAQESTRYVRYDEIEVVEPPFDKTTLEGRNAFIEWEYCMNRAEVLYKYLVKDLRIRCEVARSVLPHSLKTEIVASMNIRQWLTVLPLRAGRDAHPQIREIMFMILDDMLLNYPIIFEHLKGLKDEKE